MNTMDNSAGIYDPYSYNPMLRAYYVDSNFTNRNAQPPADVIRAAADNPQAAQHIYAVWSFLDWMKTSNPGLYSAISNQAPALVNAPQAVLSGKVSPAPRASAFVPGSYGQVNGLSGLGDIGTDEYGNAIETNAGAASSRGDVVSEWANRVLDFLPKYLQYDQQRQLVKLNIMRAEQGKPPIESSAFAPTVNIGASPAVQQLGYLAVGGLVLAGVVTAFSKAKRK